MARFFTKAFEMLDSLSGGNLFNVDGNLITPRNERVRLITLDVLNCGSPSFVAIYPDATRRELSEIAGAYENASILVQAFRTGNVRDSVSSRINYVTEHLGVLISTLHLRARGYMIGCGNYGSVDDVVAWKSPLLNKLRDHCFIAQGCTLSELADLRQLPTPGTPGTSSDSDRELVLVEVERRKSDGLSNSTDKGLNQLRKARHLDTATGLYICFPLSEQSRESPDSVRSAIESSWRDKPRIGSILFDDNGLYLHGADNTMASNSSAGVQRLEEQFTEALLTKLSFVEVLKCADRLGIRVGNRSFEDVTRNLKREIVDRADITHLLDKLTQVTNDKPGNPRAS